MRRESSAAAAVHTLQLAAAPCFAAMALLAAMEPGPLGAWCSTSHSGTSLGGMTVMYLLMAAFHCGPWLQWLAKKPLSGAA